MIHPPQVRPEEPIAVTPHDGICGGESQQWLSYPTKPHVRFDERGRETGRCRMAQATAPVLDSTGGLAGGAQAAEWVWVWLAKANPRRFREAAPAMNDPMLPLPG